MSSEIKRIGQEQVTSIFRERMPGAVIRGLAQVVASAYSLSDRNSYLEFSPAVARNHFPMEKRSRIEQGLLHLGDRYSSIGATAAALPNKRNSYNHVLLCVNGLAFTASKTNHSESFPRDACFRQGYSSLQLTFDGDAFASLEVPEKLLNGIDLYFILTHGPAIEDPSVLAYVNAIAPDRTASGRLGKVDILFEARSYIEEVVTAIPEVFPAAAKVRKKSSAS